MASGNLLAGLIDLLQRLGIRQQVERVLDRLEVVGAYQDRCRSTVACQDHPLVLVLDPVDDLGEVSLDVGKRERLCHDQYYSHSLPQLQGAQPFSQVGTVRRRVSTAHRFDCPT